MLKIVVVASISAVFVSALVLYTAPNSIASSRHHWTSLSLLLAMKPPSIETQQQQCEGEKSSNHDSSSSGGGGVRVAYLGNSIQYYNDCPRFLTNLSRRGAIVHQDSCLRGGATLVTLWTRGNGMRHKFATMNAKTTVLPPVGENGRGGGNVNDDEYVVYDVGSSTVQDLLTTSSSLLLGCDPNNKDGWDYVVVNDHTQGPARPVSQKKHEQILLDKYLPLIIDNGATPIIIETHAYRYPGINNSEDLGSTPHEFTRLVRKGVQSYIHALRTKLPETIQPRMAPVGTAFLHVHDDNYKVWESLFDPYDHFHPSPSGTFLQGCVLHWTMFDSPPPLPRSDEEIRDLWKDARVMHDISNGNQGPPLPTMIEAEYLWNVAKIICETDL